MNNEREYAKQLAAQARATAEYYLKEACRREAASEFQQAAAELEAAMRYSAVASYLEAGNAWRCLPDSILEYLEQGIQYDAEFPND